MPSAECAPTLPSLHELTKAGKTKWKAIVDKLLEALIDGTDSHFALLRLQRGIRTLVLENFAQSDVTEEVPALNASEFSIPKKKKAAQWVPNPLRTWGTVSYKEGAAGQCKTGRCSPAEIAFLRWIRQKAWFPIALNEETIGLVVLLRGNETPYRHEDIGDIWFVAQRFISRCILGSVHQRFTAISDALNILATQPKNLAGLMHGICHCLVSHTDFGWDRVWIFEEDSRDRGSFKCIASHGHFSRKGHDLAATSLQERFGGSVNEEIAWTVARPSRDPLYVKCAHRNSRCIFRVPDNECAKLFTAFDASKGNGRLLKRVSRNEPFSATMTEFRKAVRKATDHGPELYEAEKELFYLPLLIGNHRHLVFLSQVYGKRPKATVVASTVLIQRLAKVIFEWKQGSLTQKGFVLP